jgi:hypothetical protein
MATEHILSLLILERDKLNKAIEALQGSKRVVKAQGGMNEIGNASKKRKPVSAAVRKRMAAAQKKRWAEKKAGK